MMMDSDVSDVLPAVRVPTVVLASSRERGPSEYVADRIPGARLAKLPDLNSIYHWVIPAVDAIALTETRRLVDAASEELTGERLLHC